MPKKSLNTNKSSLEHFEVAKLHCFANILQICHSKTNFDLIIDSSHKQLLKNAYVDLSNSESIIRSSVRKSYKSLINWGLRNLDIKIHNSKNITLHKFNEIKMFHLLVAKKKTRSDKSWDIQYDMIKSAHGFIVEAHYMRQLASASIIIHNSKETLLFFVHCINFHNFFI